MLPDLEIKLSFHQFVFIKNETFKHVIKSQI